MKPVFFIAVYLMLFINTGCKQQSYQQKAVEIFPPVPIKNAALNRIGQLPVTPDFFLGQWTVVVFGNSSCPMACQTRLQLANDIEMAQALFVMDDVADHARIREMTSQYPELAIGMGTTAASYDNFARQFDVEAESSIDKHSFFYLINPHAELVYSLTANAVKPGDIDQELRLVQ